MCKTERQFILGANRATLVAKVDRHEKTTVIWQPGCRSKLYRPFFFPHFLGIFLWKKKNLCDSICLLRRVPRPEPPNAKIARQGTRDKFCFAKFGGDIIMMMGHATVGISALLITAAVGYFVCISADSQKKGNLIR